RIQPPVDLVPPLMPGSLRVPRPAGAGIAPNLPAPPAGTPGPVVAVRSIDGRHLTAPPPRVFAQLVRKPSLTHRQHGRVLVGDTTGFHVQVQWRGPSSATISPPLRIGVFV